MERVDKILSNLGYGSRKEIKIMMKKGIVRIDNQILKDSSCQIDPEKAVIEINGETVVYKKNIYIMMNKSPGLVSATYDKFDPTVVDLLEPEDAVFNPFPVGRLDKDTVGLLLLTNDGELNHKLIAPKYHVDKVYYAHINARVSDKDEKSFLKGIVLDDGYRCLPGKLDIIKSEDNLSEVLVTIHEGKFHQVKRMFQSLGKEVVYLKRIKFGPLGLDEELEEGQYRELTEKEVELLKNL